METLANGEQLVDGKKRSVSFQTKRRLTSSLAFSRNNSIPSIGKVQVSTTLLKITLAQDEKLQENQHFASQQKPPNKP